MKMLARVLQYRLTPTDALLWFLGILAAIGLCFSAAGLYLQRRGPTFEGRNMEQWLRVLRTDANSTEHPLRIVRVVYNDAPHCDAVEVPLSWDLVNRHGLARTDSSSPYHGEFSLRANGVWFRVIECRRATNGNCLLRFFSPADRTCDIAVVFQISRLYNFLEATGPHTRYVRNDITSMSPTNGLSQ
jgi:hypothetical protein